MSSKRNDMPKVLRGADVLVRTLAQAGTRYLFSLSGNHIMPVYDAALDAGLAIVHVRHEGAAVHMADAWGRLQGEPGIALVTGGPGHANAIGALHTAAAAEAPLVLLSGHAPLAQVGMDAFQEMRQADLAAPLVKASWTAQRAESLGDDIARAFRIARSGRPGPVHVSLPLDVLEHGGIERFAPPAAGFSAERQPMSAQQARTIAGRLASARRPLVLVGPQLSHFRGKREREALERSLGVPVVGMESPRGIQDPALGAIAEVLAQADLVLLLGKKLDYTLRFGRPPAFGSDCIFVQVDPEADSFERARRALGEPARIALTVLADPAEAAASIGREATAHPDPGWAAAVRAARDYRPPAWEQVANAPGRLHPAAVGRAVASVLARRPSPLVVIDGGEFGQWAQACVDAPLRFINGPAGSIGSAIPFALAAKLARPDASVVALLGDGTFGFHMAELDTAVRHGLGIACVIGNDARWNAEHQIQLKTYGPQRAHGCELLPSAYEEVGRALGGVGERVEDMERLVPALDRALDSGKPACVNVLIEGLAAPAVTRV
jgi:acetolactate synthase-1/2/3 large subunit